MGGIYQIRLKGHLDRRHEEWLEGFSMTRQPDGETILIGKVADQAALYGLLFRIRDLGIPLLAVNGISPGTAEEEAR
jgi:hypothetical protein